MSHLVIGARGAQGGAVARRLVADGHRVRALTREGNGPMPDIEPGIAWVPGDLADRESLRAAFTGITHASVTLPLVYDEDLMDRYTRNLVHAASSTRLRMLVVNTATRFPAAPTTVAAFETRRRATETLLASGLPVLVLRPPLYLDNLCSPWAAAPLLRDGVIAYPVAEDVRVAWLSHEDLGALTAAALDRDDLAGTVRDVCGPQPLTGPRLAAAFSEALGRPVAYRALPVAEFEAGLARVLGPAVAAEVAGSYHWLARAGADPLFEGDPGEVERTFGVPLTPLRDWIAAQPWHDLAAAAR